MTTEDDRPLDALAERARLIARGILKPGEERVEREPEREGACLRLDDAGRREAARHIQAGPVRLWKFRTADEEAERMDARRGR